MSKYAQLSLLGLLFVVALGCGGGTAKGPSADEAAKNEAAMEAEMKTMMKMVPQKPK